VRRPSGPIRWLAAAAAALLLPAVAGAAEVVYLFGVLPQGPPVAMYEKWNPLLARLSTITGATLKPKLYENMRDFEADYTVGVADLIFAHPAMMAAARRAQGYIPLVRDRNGMAGWVYVRSDSDLHTVADLQGKRIAFVGERSFCTILARLAIINAVSDLAFEEAFFGTTKNVLRAVVIGKADAGASLDSSLEAESAELRGQVRPLLTTRKFAPHPIAAHPRVPPELRDKIAAAVLEMARSDEDRRLLSAVRMAEPELADYDRDYRALEPRP
jgi:phosphonate transport system substrate-binding protein